MPAKGRTIRAGWQEYVDRVLPVDVSAIQRQETRRAFYAACAHMLDIFSDIGDDDLSEDAGVAVLEGLAAEIERHTRDVAEGRA